MRRRLLISAWLCTGLMAAAGAAAQTWPARPVRLVVYLPAGTTTDIIARAIAAPLATALGQAMPIENRPGADGVIAAEQVARSAPDGYTLLFTGSSTLTANPHLKKDLPFDGLADFTPVARIGAYNYLLAAHPALPAANLAELLQHVRANPDRLAYATGNISSKLMSAQFIAHGRLQMQEVPYKGESLAVPDLLAGRVHMMIGTPAVLAPHARQGRLRVLGAVGRRRSPLLPEVPTLEEAGVPPFTVTPSAAIMGPARLPREVVERLNRDINAVLARPEVRELAERNAFDLQGGTPEDLATFLRAQYQSWGRAIAEAGLKPQ